MIGEGGGGGSVYSRRGRTETGGGRGGRDGERIGVKRGRFLRKFAVSAHGGVDGVGGGRGE